MKKIVMISITAVLVVAMAATWFLGPMIGFMLLGKPIFVVATPKRYANFAFDVAANQGIYADNPEFQKVLAAAEEELKSVDSIEQTHPIIKKVLKSAGGKHSNLIPPERNQPETADEAELPTVSREGEIVIATVPSVGRGPVGQQYADSLAGGLQRYGEGACGVIVDLRGNGGGDMGPMLAGLSSLLPDGPVMGFKSRMYTTDVVIEGGSVTGGGSPMTVASTSKFTGPVAVLVDNGTASSGEATMLSFRGLENSKSFGQPTAGYASANIVIDMPDGAGIMLTVANDVARTGEEFSEDPIQPDVVTDDAQAQAIEWINQKCVR